MKLSNSVDNSPRATLSLVAHVALLVSASIPLSASGMYSPISRVAQKDFAGYIWRAGYNSTLPAVIHSLIVPDSFVYSQKEGLWAFLNSLNAEYVSWQTTNGDFAVPDAAVSNAWFTIERIADVEWVNPLRMENGELAPCGTPHTLPLYAFRGRVWDYYSLNPQPCEVSTAPNLDNGGSFDLSVELALDQPRIKQGQETGLSVTVSNCSSEIVFVPSFFAYPVRIWVKEAEAEHWDEIPVELVPPFSTVGETFALRPGEVLGGRLKLASFAMPNDSFYNIRNIGKYTIAIRDLLPLGVTIGCNSIAIEVIKAEDSQPEVRKAEPPTTSVSDEESSSH